MRSTTRLLSSASRTGLVAAAVALALAAGTARADNTADLAALKSQVQSLQSQISALEARGNGGTTATTATTGTAAKPTPTFNAGPVTITLGGFAELIGVERSRFEGADWASNWNGGIPLANSSNYYLDEFHMTMRQSRLSALAQAPTDGHTAIEAYVETDFGAAGGTANNNESASYSPRVRHFYGDYQDKDNGWYLLAGQTWSLVTQDNSLINPRSERAPLTIDGQYLPGFSWLRVAQVRFVKNFADNHVAAGLSLENPAALVSCSNSTSTSTACVGPTTTVVPTAPITSIAGQGGAYPNGTLSLDPLPDVVGKIAFEPGFGHYEVLGTYRTFRDRYAGNNNSTSGFGFGGNLVLPLLGPSLEFNASYLHGEGIGRYGSAQLPDVTVNPTSGKLDTIRGDQYYAGLTWKPVPTWVVYAYYGSERVTEQSATYVDSKGETIGQGVGSPLFDNTGCYVEGGVTGHSCYGNTKSVTQETIGAWWKYYQGTLGNAQIGLQASHSTRDVFTDAAGHDPSSDLNVYMVSFRFYPYQR